MFAEIASIAGPLIGGLMGSEAAGDAAAAQGRATDAAIAEQRRQFDTSRADLAPYRQLGSAAVGRVGQLLGLGDVTNPSRTLDQIKADLRSSGRYTLPGYEQQEAPGSQYGGTLGTVLGGISRSNAGAQPLGPARYDDAAIAAEAQRIFGAQPQAGAAGPTPESIMAMDPGYQFRLGEGMKGLDRQVGAMGLRNSGAALKAMQRYGQDYASGEFGNVFNRLSGAAGTGQTATTTGAGLGAQNAQTIGGMMTGLGNARGAAAIGGANAIGGALNTVGNYFGQQGMLDKILNRGGYSGQSNADIASMYNF
jgi:hypothetical protein